MALSNNTLWTIGGGKGGVGKSFLTASMAVVLARMGRRVIVIDANQSVPTLHSFLGIRIPSRSLLDVLDDASTLDSALVQTCEPGLQLLSCTRDTIGLNEMDEGQKKALLDLILGLRADQILVDLGTGTGTQALEMFSTAHTPILVSSPDPISIQCTYGFLRNAFFLRLQQEFATNPALQAGLDRMRNNRGGRRPTLAEFCSSQGAADPEVSSRLRALLQAWRPSLVLNMASSEQDHRTAVILQSAVGQSLGLELRVRGVVGTDPTLSHAAQRMSSLDFDDADNSTVRQLRSLIGALLEEESVPEDVLPVHAEPPVPCSPVQGMNDNIEFLGRQLHIQTEDTGLPRKCITTQVFLNGRVVHSTRQQYGAPGSSMPDREQISELMRSQHLSVMREIEGQKMRVVPS